MRYTPVLAAVLVAVAAWSCGGGKQSQPAPSATNASPPATSAAASPAPSRTGTAAQPAQGSPQSGADEVTGIVGSVNASARSIEINRRSGANVTKITVSPSTVIRAAGGGTLTLTQIRSSDRIIARGEISERGDALIASEITVQDVVPGAQPGG